MQIFSLILLLSAVNTSPGIGLPVESYDEIAANTFWNELYANGGWSLYCGYRFGRSDDSNDERRFVIEHIYPVSWMLEHMKCNSRRQCRLNSDTRYTRMEADMHNLYPVWQETNRARRQSSFGLIEGEYWRFDNCDFERRKGLTEPRPIARGNIARAIFYMHSQYGVPIKSNLLQQLKDWNREDPPSQQEIQRNNLIEELQGTRNRYIDNPALAEQISDKWVSGE